MKTAIVVEGGGMRGVFSAGVLDLFHEENYDPFDMYLGASAGACNLSSFVAKQYKRNIFCYHDLLSNTNFINIKQFLRGGHLMDLDWAWETFDREIPLDTETAYDHIQKKDFWVVCTSLKEKGPIYIRPEPKNWNNVLKASCSVPVLYRNVLEVSEHPVTDGGVADPIPVIEAYRQGARKIVVIRSRPSDYLKSYGIDYKVGQFFYRNSPAMQKILQQQIPNYRRAVEFIQSPPKDAEIFQIAPPAPLKTSRTTRNRKSLLRDYQLGYDLGNEFLKKVS